MKNYDIRDKTILFFGLFLFGIGLAYFALSGSYLFLQNRTSQVVESIRDKINALVPRSEQENSETEISRDSQKCSTLSRQNGLQHAEDLGLQRLNQLEELCNSGATSTMMMFTSMPNSEVTAKRMASALAVKLREYKKYGIQPLVIIEPETAWGLIDFDEFGTGFYSVWIEEYFAQLKRENISDKEMGIWVPFPEANLPYWNRTSSRPEQFGKNVTIYLTLLRKYFPTTKTSILLNAASYPSEDFNWENGTYTSLIPYIKGIEPGLVDSFGIQGFPWKSPASNKKVLEIYDPAEFLNANLAIEAANYLKVKSIWLNTGTFRTKYSNNSELLVTITPSTREKILTSILNQVSYLQAKGFTISVNVFAEDKTNTSEATDWSYWGRNTNEVNQHTVVLLNFINQLSQSNAHFWYFDRSKPTNSETSP